MFSVRSCHSCHTPLGSGGLWLFPPRTLGMMPSCLALPEPTQWEWRPGASGHLCLHLRICKCNYWESLRPSHVQTHIALQMVIKVDGVTAPPWMKSSRLTSSVGFLLHPIKIIQTLTFFWVGYMVSLSSATFSCNIWIRWSFCSICNELFSCSHCFQLVIASLPAILLCFFTTL